MANTSQLVVSKEPGSLPCPPDYVSRIAEGLTCVEHALLEVHSASSLRAVCLHGNMISSCSGLKNLLGLTELNLSANRICSVKDLHPLPALRQLNLASNKLEDLDAFPSLSSLSRLNVAHNLITNLSGLSILEGGCLHSVDIRSNRLNELQTLAVFSPISSLQQIKVSGGTNPNHISQLPNLHMAVSLALPHVSKLDNCALPSRSCTPADVRFAALQLAALQTAPRGCQVLSPRASPSSHHPQPLRNPCLTHMQPTSHESLLPSAQPLAASNHTAQCKSTPQPAAAMQQPSGITAAKHNALAEADNVENTSTAANSPEPLARCCASPQPKADTSKAGCNGTTFPRPCVEDETIPAEWQAHEKRLAMLEESLLQRASCQSQKHSAHALPIDRIESGTQTDAPLEPSPPLPQARSQKSVDRSVSVQTAAEDLPEMQALQSRTRSLEVELLRAVEALEHHEAAAAADRSAASQALTAAESAAAARIQEARAAADAAVSSARMEQERQGWELSSVKEQLAKAEAGLQKAQLDANRIASATQEEMRQLHSSAAAAQLEVERERLKRQASESEQAATARAEAAAVRQQLHTARTEAQRLHNMQVRLLEDKEALEAALSSARGEVRSARSQLSKGTEELSEELAKVRRENRALEERLHERSVIEKELKGESSKLAAALASCQVAHDKALARAESAAQLRLDAACVEARQKAYQEAAAEVEAAAREQRKEYEDGIERLRQELEAQQVAHHSTLANIREDTRELLAEHDRVLAQLEAERRKNEMQAASWAQSNEEREAVVRDMMALVQQQRVKLQGSQADVKALQAQLADTSTKERLGLTEKALEECRKELQSAVAAAAVEKEAAQTASRNAADADARAADAVQRASEESAAAAAKAAAAEELQAGAQERISCAEESAADAVDALKIKKVMLDSASEQIAELKVELEEAMQDAMDARATLEDRNSDAEDRVAALERELDSARTNSVALQTQLNSVQQQAALDSKKLQDLDAALQKAQAAVSERDRMLKEVEQGMDQVKELYGKKVERIEQERVVTVERCSELQVELNKAHDLVQLSKSQAREHVEQAEAARRCALVDAENSKEAMAQAEARVMEVEKEMRLLLQAFEDERAASAAKAAQLAEVLNAWK